MSETAKTTKTPRWTAEKQRKAEANWRKAHAVKLTLQFNRETDADILEWLESRPETRTSYLRRLIREDIAREQGKQ